MGGGWGDDAVMDGWVGVFVFLGGGGGCGGGGVGVWGGGGGGGGLCLDLGVRITQVTLEYCIIHGC